VAVVFGILAVAFGGYEFVESAIQYGHPFVTALEIAAPALMRAAFLDRENVDRSRIVDYGDTDLGYAGRPPRSFRTCSIRRRPSG
jgi:hypothetical protein